MEKSARNRQAVGRRRRKRRDPLERLLHLAVGFVVLVAFVGVSFIGIYEGLQTRIIEKVERHYFYPYPYQQIVNKYAKEYGVDSSLVAGVILAESKFLPTACSNRGAIGLMQIMPDTGAWIAKHVGDKDYTKEQLYNPDTNIRFGVWYLSFLIDAGALLQAVSAYRKCAWAASKAAKTV